MRRIYRRLREKSVQIRHIGERRARACEQSAFTLVLRPNIVPIGGKSLNFPALSAAGHEVIGRGSLPAPIVIPGKSRLLTPIVVPEDERGWKNVVCQGGCASGGRIQVKKTIPQNICLKLNGYLFLSHSFCDETKTDTVPVCYRAATVGSGKRKSTRSSCNFSAQVNTRLEIPRALAASTFIGRSSKNKAWLACRRICCKQCR